MPPTADTAAPPSSPATGGISGKILIIGIFTVALIGAGGSWLFRYSATHRAAEFWGPENARRIRDAAIVELIDCRRLSDSDSQQLQVNQLPDATLRRDVSRARGMAHLRNALLEDQSYSWPEIAAHPKNWDWAIVFREPNREGNTVVLISGFKFVNGRMGTLSCAPISAGLEEMIREMSAETHSSAPDEQAPSTPAR